MIMFGKRKCKKIGLALGSGAARGMAHIGILKVLEEEAVPIDYIAGTSFGAFIGALYAAGVPVAQMEEVALNLDWKRLARLVDPILPTAGLIDGRKVRLFMEDLLPVRTFEELLFPLAMVATDVETGESLVIKRGNLMKALRAAVAFPGIFTPVLFGDRFLIDGGVCNPIPVDVVRDLGAEVVVGICTIPEVEKPVGEAFLPAEKSPKKAGKNALPEFFAPRNLEKRLQEIGLDCDEEEMARDRKERRPPNIFKVCAQSVAIMENEIAALRLERNRFDLLIRPDLNGITLLEFHRAEESIRAGEQAMRHQIRRLKELAGLD